MAANAGGKAVNKMTTMSISHTWSASQIGPMARLDGVSLRVGAWPGREQIPHAAAVIGVAGDGIKNQRHEHETGDNELKHFS